MAQEYYIRQPDSEVARGPLTIEKLASLAEASKLDTETLYYDDDKEAWIAIGSNPELKGEIFPEKKTLSLRQKREDEIQSLNLQTEEAEEVNVDELLAASEGETEETRHLKVERTWRERTAAVTVPALGMLMLLSALTFIGMHYQLIYDAIVGDDDGWVALVQAPLLYVGVIDLALGLFTLMAVTELYPILRFRAVAGLGYFGFLGYAGSLTAMPGAELTALAAAAFSLGIFVVTLTLKFATVLFFTLLGLAGAIGFAYIQVVAPLLAEAS